MKTIITRTHQAASKNSTNILAALGVSGVIYTAYLAAKGGMNAQRRIDAELVDREFLTKKEKLEVTWKFYIPAAVSGTSTIVFIVAANRVGAQKTAAMAAAYSITEKAFHEYREKIIEEIGPKKEELVRAEIAQAKMEEKPPPADIIVGDGLVLTCELYTMRYLTTSMDKLRKAENQINADINNGVYSTLSDFYDLLGIAHTSVSDTLGWDGDTRLELMITTSLSPHGQPCLAFDYKGIKLL